MKAIVPADVRAIRALLRDRDAERPSWRGHPMLSYWLFVIAVMVELLTQSSDDVVLPPFLFAAAIIFNRSIYGNPELRFTLPKNILLKPVSSVRIALAVFFSMCTLRCLPLIAAYVSYAGIHVLTSGQGYQSLFVVPLLVAFPMLIGASLTLSGTLWLRAVSAVVLVSACGLWVTLRCPIWMNTQLWYVLCLLAALLVGAGLSVIGVTQMRRGAGKSGRRLNAEPMRSVISRVRRGDVAFADAEAAETWRQWRCAWCVMPLGFIGMALFGLANTGYHAYVARFFNSANGGNGVGVEPFILPGMIVIGMVVGPALAGRVAATTVRSMGSLATRTLSVQALARCMFRGAMWGIAPTALLALGVFGLFRESLLAGGRWGHGVDYMLLVVYGLLAMWAATWSSVSVNYFLMGCLFCLYSPLSLVMRGAGCGGAGVGLSVLLFVGALLTYVVRAFYLAARNGFVTVGACWTACAVAAVLVAVPLLHCPAWLAGYSAPLRVGVIVSVVALATAPMASVPLLCKAILSGPETEPVPGWNGYRMLKKGKG